MSDPRDPKEKSKKFLSKGLKVEDTRALEGRIAELEELLEKENEISKNYENRFIEKNYEVAELNKEVRQLRNKVEIYKFSLNLENPSKLAPWLIDQIEYHQEKLSNLEFKLGKREYSLTDLMEEVTILTERLRVSEVERDSYEEDNKEWRDYAEKLEEELKEIVELKESHEEDIKQLEKLVDDLEKDIEEKEGKSKQKSSKSNDGEVRGKIELGDDAIKKNCQILHKNSSTLVERMRKYVKGQDSALYTLKENLIAHFGGLGEDLPITFFLHGPTGCGKTYIAEVLSNILFKGSLIEPELLEINCSEYQEHHEISKLIGSPPGYVRSEEKGLIPRHIETNPVFSVVLLDEIEKAHKSLYNILLKPLDKGGIGDNSGNIHYCRKYIFIMTSNVGEHDAQRTKTIGGFGRENFQESRNSVIDKIIKETFPPEFRNRIDASVHFDYLNKEAIDDILEIELDNIDKRSRDVYGNKIVFSQYAKEKIIELGFSRETGARELKRTLKKYVQGSVKLIEVLEKGNMAYVDYNKGEFVYESILEETDKN